MENGNMVEIDAICMPEQGDAAVADTQAQTDEVSAADLIGDGAAGEEQTVLYSGQADAAQNPGRTYSKEEFDATVRRKIDMATRDMMNRMEKDPVYTLGRKIVQEKARIDGTDERMAAEELLHVGGILPVTPAVWQARESMPLPTAAARELEGRPEVIRVGQELFQCMLDGDVPGDMKVADYAREYPGFLSDCVRFGVKAALRTVHALRGAKSQQNAALERMAKNRALPKPMRPTYSEAQNGKIDYTEMTTEHFMHAKEKMVNDFVHGKKSRL